MSNDFSLKNICICAATYLRPNGLRQLLDSINSLDVESLINTVQIRVVIVDNDPKQSALSVVEAFRKNGFRFSLEYIVEPQRGISRVRNRLLQAAKDFNADVIAMIDDDETVDRKWLFSGLKAMQEWNSDVIFGHLIPIFKKQPPRWIEDGGYYEFPVYENGSLLKEAYTYNILFKSKLLSHITQFDESLNFVGSEDVLFFRQAYKQGFKINFCSLAIVYDHIPEERVNLNWILRRRFRSSLPVDLIINEKSNKSNLGTKTRLTLQSLFFIALLLCFAPVIILRVVPFKVNDFLGKFFGPRVHLLLRRINNGYRGFLWFFVSRVGVISGVFGSRYHEYANPTVELKNNL